jgi:vacuolar-type H+-ATPase subunit H
MSNDRKTDESGTTAEQAMNVVLQAEQDAKQRIDQCRQEADSLLQQARQKAKRISERVDGRITRIHQRCSRVISDQVKQLQLEQEQRARDAHHYQLDMETVDVVVEQIAEMLTTPEQGKKYNRD